MNVIEQPTVTFEENATTTTATTELPPPTHDRHPKETSTPRKIVRAIFIAAETATILLTLLLYVPHPVDWTRSALPAIPFLLLPFASVAMLFCRFWLAGFSGLLTTVIAFVSILTSPFIRLC